MIHIFKRLLSTRVKKGTINNSSSSGSNNNNEWEKNSAKKWTAYKKYRDVRFFVFFPREWKIERKRETACIVRAYKYLYFKKWKYICFRNSLRVHCFVCLFVIRLFYSFSEDLRTHTHTETETHRPSTNNMNIEQFIFYVVIAIAEAPVSVSCRVEFFDFLNWIDDHFNDFIRFSV